MKNLLLKRFQFYKDLGDKTFEQLNDEQIFWQVDEGSNSIATIVKHISGNMISRWTHFLNEDGEKSWRNRDAEFENNLRSKAEMLEIWERGWNVFYDAFDQISPENMEQIILIRGEEHTVIDALLRQLGHYPYHIGQLVFIGKMLKKEEWKNLSIAKNDSQKYTEELLKKQCSDEIAENSSPVCFAKSEEVREEYRAE